MILRIYLLKVGNRSFVAMVAGLFHFRASSPDIRILTKPLITVLPIFMQAFSVISEKTGYNRIMPAGRPARSTQRTPFGERLYKARMAKGLSQSYVAGELGIAQPSYADWERKAVSLKPEYLPVLAEVFGVSVEELLGTESPKRKGGGPTGRLRRVFDQVNELPHSQQKRIVSMVEDMLIAQKAKKAS